VIAQVRDLAERFVNHGVERDDASDEVAPNRAHFRQLRADQRERGGEPVGDFSRNLRKPGRQPATRATEIGSGEDDSGADDAEADFAGAEDGEHEHIATGTPDRTEVVAGDDRRRIAGQRRRVCREVAQQRRHERTGSAPQSEAHEVTKAVLGKARGQHHDHHSADHGADHAEPTLAQRRADARLTDDRRGCAGPIRVVELEPEGDVEGKADGGP
jgi:hypothetical protein